jgi:septum formation protein
LDQLGLDFTVYVPKVEELLAPSRRGKQSPEAVVKKIAAEKAHHAAAELRGKGTESALILAADTLVFQGSRVLGKPHNKKEAAEMLAQLSGKKHIVATAVHGILLDGKKSVEKTVVVKTEVKFHKLSAGFLKWYLDTEEPYDKAGAYGAQGIGASFVETIQGSYTNVVGLPLAETVSLIEALTKKPWHEWCCPKKPVA